MGLDPQGSRPYRTRGWAFLCTDFAGGGAARSVSGPSCKAYLPGMGLCTAVTLGRLAGKSAALLAQDI